MAKRRSRQTDRPGRPPMSSPGRPPINRREVQQRFWRKIAEGLSSEDARAEISNWIEFYNTRRRHSRAGRRSPINHELAARTRARVA